MLHLTSVDPAETKTEALIIPVCENYNIHSIAKISDLIDKAKELKEFKGKKDDEVLFYNMADVKAERVIFFGIGKYENIDLEVLRAFAGKAVKKSLKKGLSNISIVVPLADRIIDKINFKKPDVVSAVMEGALLGNHLFDKYKKEKENKPVEKIDFLVPSEVAKECTGLPEKVSIICQGTILAREWISTPPNDKRPEQFTKAIVTCAEKENLKITLLDEKKLKKQNFGALLAVAKGSTNKPGLVVLEYNPAKADKTLVLVGKGVTFDSGGINLKPAGSLEDMKMDMSGAAVVAAIMITAAKLKPGTRVVGIMPIVENMPSGDAARPGDIIKTYEGKTVEIGNTDAEGRLILIDAISYGIKQYNPDIIIDIATLTGACVIALGEKIAGIFSPDEHLSGLIVQSGIKTHERCWKLPLPDDYKEFLKSEFADINNISNIRWGGAITAALFLKEFTGGTKWAHIDIAGPAYIKKENAYCGAGGTGFGVRLLYDVIEKL